jgi:hypothetical protein
VTLSKSNPRARPRWVALGGSVAAMLLLLATAVLAAHPEVSLTGANFEIDTNANLKVDDAAPSIDWASVTETRKADKASGSGDDSFGQGTKEDTAVPTVVDGSIPPNKSDLLNFGVYLETNANGRFLNLFWHRVQEPSGTTNMDFEFNKSSTTSSNGVTPVRTAGDLLIQYDLSQGGTNPVLFKSVWITSGATSQCEASNSLPCWGTKTNMTATGDATGSINTSAIPAGESDGLGAISVRTFGEAQLDFDALTGGGGSATCTSFGSAYLKSRSSDSFTAALKDFIAPTPLNLSNCGTVIIRKETDPEENPNATSFGYTKNFATQPSTANTFSLTDDGVQSYTGVLQGTGYVVDESTIPTGWDLTSINCNVAAHPSVGVTPTIGLAAGTVTFAIDDPTDVLDCTYTNRARGTIIVEKITDDGQGAFDFTSGTLGDGTFTLTTTAAGAGGKDSETFADLAPGSYDVAETVPAGWNLVSSACDDGSNPATIGLSAGETVTCTFHDARERGVILIDKDRKHAASGPGDHPHAGVTFTVTGGSTPAGGASGQTNAIGRLCVDNLVVSSLAGNYTVTETVPAGYVAKSTNPRTGIVVTEGTCATATPIDFDNMPLTDITVTVNSQVDGGTASTIECGFVAANPDATTNANGDGTLTKTNLEPGTYTCTIVVDP